MIESANTLQVFDQLFATTQNNVNNANTPGYAKQRLATVSLAFDPALGLPGGVTAGQIQSSRDLYAEQDVRQQNQAWGRADQQSTDLQRIEPVFDISQDAGIPGALSQFFQNVSSWSMAPNDTVARQTVIDSAGTVAAQFTQSANSLGNASSAIDQETGGAVGAINNLAGQICQLNAVLRSDARNQSDPGIDAQMQSTLENLSEYVNFTALKQSDGTVEVLAGGQTPLVIEDRQYTISADMSGAQTVIRDSNQNDITAQIQSGRLAGLLDTKNNLLPSYMSGLNQLASGFADSVNGLLAAGVDTNGNSGAALFSYDPTSSAATLAVTSITPDELAGAVPAAPGGNGNALNLAALGNSPQINGMSFTAYYGELAGRVGQAVQDAKNAQQTTNDLLVQARSLRSDVSGVSLDEEAANLIQYQRAYEANAKLVTVLDELTNTTINLL